MRTTMLITCLLYLGGIFSLPAHAEENEKYAVYYSDKAPIEHFNKYQLLVLDSRYHPPLQALSEGGKTLLGYISLGELEQTSPYFGMLKKRGLILGENENWKGSYSIDMRDPLWQKIVIEEIIPTLLREGFAGVFFDTLDNPIELERENPTKYKGMEKAAIQLVQAIRMHYPTIKIMVNRAYEILPQISPYIDMELGESVRHTYDFNKKTYGKVDESTYRLQVQLLQEAKQRNPKLKVYTLDYANKKDHKKIADIYRIQRENGFIPYVATIALDELVEETTAIGSIQ